MSEYKRANETVRWNEQRYRTLFDLGPVAVYSCDVSGVIQEYNRRAVELWGCEPALGDTDKRFFVARSSCTVRTAVSCRMSSAPWRRWWLAR